MFASEHEPLAFLVELTPKHAKKRFRDDIYKYWSHQCVYCNEKATSLDHIIPRHRSGETVRKNLVPACRSCNESKASQKLHDWYLDQPFFNEVRLNRIEQWMWQEPFHLEQWNQQETMQHVA
jgi:5-methylcytosine-specific restriction endonuclease McrA